MAIQVSGTTVVDNSRNLTNIKKIEETAVDQGNDNNISLTGGTVFYASPSSNKSYTFSGADTVTTVMLKITPTASISISWPSSVAWAEGTAPDVPASGTSSMYVFHTHNGGTNWFGFLAGYEFA